MNCRKWSVFCLALTGGLIIATVAVTVIIDPFFHYHAPLKALVYPLNNERYQNDGISKRFSYDTLIIGTSMIANMEASECDRLFQGKTVKLPYPGASYYEVGNAMKKALDANPELKTVIRCLDSGYLFFDKDRQLYEDIPEYLYDRNPLNDEEYLLNKEVACKYTFPVLSYTLSGGQEVDFDQYARFLTKESSTADPRVLEMYRRPSQKAEFQKPISEEELAIVRESIEQNVVEAVRQHPDTIFYIYMSPYSVCWYDQQYRYGELGKFFAAEKLVAELLLECENVRMYTFDRDYEMICDLYAYDDILHTYPEWNSRILQNLYDGKFLLTKENYQAHFDEAEEFYMNLDYDAVLGVEN